MRRIKVGVIPAAGHGRRLSSLPLTRVLPKSLLPILNKPILGYVIDNMKQIGVEELYMIVGFKKELIQEYFEDGKDFGLKINYIVQPEPLGIAHAVGLTKGLISEPFVVMLGDDLTLTKSLDNVVDLYFAKKAFSVEGVVCEENIENLRQACCLSLDNEGRIISAEEKPCSPSSKIRGCGIYLFDSKVFEFIDKTPLSPPRNEREITNTIRLIAKIGSAYGAFIDGVNINVNTNTDLLKATMLLLENSQT
ncbi:MAG: nucleotidyltransferase family protein [Candidatus Bathyarchaeia archaeon]|jgi:dTDP-glucose pyrophosphorylase